MKPAIRVEGLSKRYRLGATRVDNNLTENLKAGAGWAWRKLTGRARAAAAGAGEFWALKDVSFEVKPGEVVGIIGRNGAGKSTLLKVLSRIAEPTSGRAEIRGRMGSLLEVGTGFHPELTGRENVYLNGSVLGMSHTEIARKFDEIVAFSGVEAFLDTPVKRYSSGMYVRLAFAVAAHLEPDILIIDEVLAVGDAEFQQKCLGKMRDVAGQGRAVLVVSHNLSVIENLCARAVLLRQGRLLAAGPCDEVLREYRTGLEASARQDVRDRSDRKGRGEVRFQQIEVRPLDPTSDQLLTGRPAEFVFHVSPPAPAAAVEFTIYDGRGYPVANFNSTVRGDQDRTAAGRASVARCRIDALWLVPGRYRVNAAVTSRSEMQDYLEAAAVFEVYEHAVGGRSIPEALRWGSTHLIHQWDIEGNG